MTPDTREALLDGWIDSVISFSAARAAAAPYEAMLAGVSRADGRRPTPFQSFDILFAENVA